MQTPVESSCITLHLFCDPKPNQGPYPCVTCPFLKSTAVGMLVITHKKGLCLAPNFLFLLKDVI